MTNSKFTDNVQNVPEFCDKISIGDVFEYKMNERVVMFEVNVDVPVSHNL